MSDLIKNKIPCDVIQDIIPLYHDNVCSSKSREYVDEHLKSCKDCSGLLKSLDDDRYDRSISNETKDVLAHHAKHEMTTAATVGLVFAGIFMLPVIIMLVVAMAGKASIGATMVLIASMLLVSGLTVVPLMSNTKKLAKTIVFSTISLLLIILFSQIFFYQNGVLYFFETAFSVIFGLSIPFFPFVIRQMDLPEALADKKGLITMSWDTIWFYVMMTAFAVGFPNSAKDLLVVGTFGIALPWIVFLIARYLKFNRLTKAGAIMVAIDAWLISGVLANWVTIEIGNKPGVVSRIIYIGLAVGGAVLAAVGLMTGKKTNK